MNIKFCLLFFVSIFSLDSTAQNFTISGKVKEVDNNIGVPFANVYFENNNQLGTYTDVDGYFSIATDYYEDSLVVSSIGLKQKKIWIGANVDIEINFSLESNAQTLVEAVVYAGENPAIQLVKNIKKQSGKNKVSALKKYEVERYSKTEIDLKNVKKTQKLSRVFKPFDFIWENLDTTSSGDLFLPAFIVEEISNLYLDKSISNELVIIKKAIKNSGVENVSLVSFMSKLDNNFSVYDNWISILEKSFAGPFGNVGLAYYDYYIQDSLSLEGRDSYKVKFKPKRRQEQTFEGFFWVDKESFAINRLTMQMSEDVNINLINDIRINQEFMWTDNRWLPSKQNLLLDFEAIKNKPGLIGRKTVSYKNFNLNFESEDFPKRKYIAPETLLQEDEYWDNNRHGKLTKNETLIYNTVDSIKSMPIYRTYADLFYTIFNGYKEYKNIEIGPYFSLYSNNEIEGHRMRLGLRTSTIYSKKIRFGGYAAFGSQDKKWKYGGDLLWIMRKTDYRSTFHLNYVNDLDLNIPIDDEISEGNIVSGFFRRKNMVRKIAHKKSLTVTIDNQTPNGWYTALVFNHQNIDPFEKMNDLGQGFNFVYSYEGKQVHEVTSAEVGLKLRYAYKQEFIDFYFDRSTLPSKYPILQLKYTVGVPDIFGSEYKYQKLDFYMRYWFKTGIIGWSRFVVRAGKVFGEVPYLLLQVPNGNETFFQSFLSFNAMNKYEFASDKYISLIYEHHFDGFFLNKIPFIRKLKWREVATFKSFFGSLSKENRRNNEPNYFNLDNLETFIGFRTPDTVPYMEFSVGIENIFKVFRIDAIWRSNYLDNPEAYPFALKVGMNFAF